MHSNRDFDEILVSPNYEPLSWFMIIQNQNADHVNPDRVIIKN